MNAIVPRDTITRICDQRDQALKLYAEAFEALQIADAAIMRAHSACHSIAPRVNRFNQPQELLKKCFAGGLKVAPRDDFLATARKIVDTDAWAHLIEMTELERLMDKKAKDEFGQQLLKEPPEATAENILATLEQFALDAGTIFKRGIAVCFSNLDRRFRSHDGWKIGNRIVMTYAFNAYGSWNYHRNERDTLMDVERAFFVLDGKTPPPNYGGIVASVDESRGGWGVRQSLAESEYFRARGFKNGNLHLWFKRDDLLDKVNQLLGEYYGDVIPEEREPEKDTGLNNPKTELARNYGFFPSPERVVAELLDRAPFYREKGEALPRILEPSAGLGPIAVAAGAKGAHVDCIEIEPDRAAFLANLGFNVIRADFLSVQPTADYDMVLMNPPFDRERDIDHVVHALKFLKPWGYLAAVMSAGTEFRETRKSIAFRELVEKKCGSFSDLPAGSFSSVGTNVNTVILRLYNDGRKVW